MSRRISLIIIFLSSFLLSCFPARKLRPPEKIDPEETIQILRSQETNLNSTGIYLEFKFRGKGKRFSTEAEVFYEESEAFTIYFKSSSHLNVLKSVIRNDSVSFYLPERNEYYHDSYDNFSRTKGWEWGIGLEDFLNLIIGKNGFGKAPLRFIKRVLEQLKYLEAILIYF